MYYKMFWTAQPSSSVARHKLQKNVCNTLFKYVLFISYNVYFFSKGNMI